MEASKAIELLRGATRLVILTGAGVSTESGIPDFRGSSGIWTRFDPDDFRYERFVSDPRGFWTLRAELMEALDLEKAQPNPAHEAIARASRSARVLGHVTQNIDGLFQRAGHVDEKLVEVHGSARKVRCIGCWRFFPYSAISLETIPPRCPACGGILKPGTILFGESLHEPDLRRAETWFSSADTVLVVGSSLAVHPVAGLPQLALSRGASLVIANRDPTPYDEDAGALVREAVGVAIPKLLSAFV